MSFTVLVTDYAWPSLDIERSILGETDAQLIVAEQGDESELTRLAPSADAILTNWRRLPESALDAATRCLVVARYGVGLDNIPVDHATKLGIIVCNVPDFCLEEVSDHAMALLLSCARRVVAFARSTRQGVWDLSHARGLPRLRGQTLGLVGFGNTARAIVPKAQGFGLRIIAYTPRVAPGVGPLGVELTNDLDWLLAESDYVSIHVPSTPETHRLVGEAQLRRMKRTAYLINTARGSVVDEVMLEVALREGWIAGAGLDVLGREPPSAQNPLLVLDNVVVTPHAAFYSETAIEELQTKAATNVLSVISGEVPATLVNPDVLGSSVYRLGLLRGA